MQGLVPGQVESSSGAANGCTIIAILPFLTQSVGPLPATTRSGRMEMKLSYSHDPDEFPFLNYQISLTPATSQSEMDGAVQAGGFGCFPPDVCFAACSGTSQTHFI